MKKRQPGIPDNYMRYPGYLAAGSAGGTHQRQSVKVNLPVTQTDMPAAAFADLWQTVASGLPWHGLVKNRCKNGDHYWVRAFVVPARKDGQPAGHMSVRTEPSRDELRATEATSMSRSISAATVAQTQASEAVVSNMERITRLIDGNLQASRDAKQAVGELRATSGQFRAMIGEFRIHKV